MENLEKILRNYLKQFGKLGQKQKVAIVIILAVSFIIGLGGQVVYQKLTYKPYPTPIPLPTEIPLSASLELTTDLPTDEMGGKAEVGATFSAILNIDSPNQGVEAADFVIRFDPSYLKVATVSAGNYFGLYPIKEISTDSAKISGIANLVNNRFLIPKGKGVADSIVFETLEATESTKISFDREKTIVASNGKNILGEIKDLSVKIE
jgi:hypothetical protein